MKSNFYLLIVFVLLGFSINSQVLQNSNLSQGGGEPAEKCRAGLIHERLLQTDPQYAQRRLEIEQHYENYLHNAVVNKTNYTIPVVVHVIHTGQAVGTGINISDAQIQSAIDNLNAAYSNTNTAHTTYTGQNTNIQFCLAQRDASGNPTTGIVRVDGSGVTQYSTKGICDATGGTGTDNEVAVKALSKWDNTKYYNIWVVSEINDNGGGSGTQGYAYFPGAGASVDGSVMLYNAFGYDPDGSLAYNLKSYTNRNVTAVHEMGHALNLHHTFQGDGTGSTCPTDAVCGTSGDCVADTPRHKRSTSGCVSDATANACQGGTTAGDYQHNFMDYSSDVCQTEFTAGQVTRLNAAMAGGRASLNASDGCNPVYTRDVGVQLIISPNSSTCGTTFVPSVRVKNFGSGTITSFTINYNLDGGTNETYAWTGSLTSGSTEDITLSSMTSTAGAHTFNATTVSPNGLSDEYSSNDAKNYVMTIIGTPPTAANCTPTTSNLGNYGTGIDRVQFNALDHAHTDNDNDGLQDFTCLHNTTVSTNTSYNLTVTTQDNEYVIAYIDYDDDGNFESGELVLDHHNSNSGLTHTVSVLIPQYPSVTGKLIRMRIKSNFNTMTIDPCIDSDYGEFEDYSVFITTPPCVAPVLNSSPVDLSGCSGSNGTMTVDVTGPSLTYEWQVNDGSGFVALTNGGVYSGVTSSILTFTGFTSGMLGYTYRCFISNPCGNVTSDDATLFALDQPTAACSPVTNNTGNFGTGIVRFQYNGIDNVHNDLNNDGTRSFICTDATTATLGSTMAFTITGSGGNAEYARIYIDYNDNGTFEAGEIAFNNNTTRQNSHTGNITIPTSGVVTGKLLRIRVITDFAIISGGCANLTYGEVEDYGLHVLCESPTVDATSPSSRCGQGTVTISATPSAGTIKWYAAASGGAVLGTGNSFVTPIISATTTYYAEAVHSTCVSAARTAVTATVVPATQVQLSQQGSTLPFLGSTSFTGTAIVADAVPGATTYRFRVTEGVNVYTIDRNVRWFYLGNLPVYDYGKTYSVEVSVDVAGSFACYGTAYDVHSPVTPPVSQVVQEQRGVRLPSVFDRIYADERANATKYRFTVNYNSTSHVIETTNRFFTLSQLPGYTYDTEYSIRVAVEHSSFAGFGADGVSYSVWSPAISQLQGSQCPGTLANVGTAIIANEVAMATKYRFEITQNGVTQILERDVRWFYLANMSSYALGRVMKVRVSVQKGGVWGPYWTSCYVTTPATSSMQQSSDEITQMTEEFKVEAYPNPNSGEFTISSTNEGTFNLVNELGQLIQTIEITKENNFEAKVVGMENGFYFLTGVINGNVVTNRIVVLK